MANNFRSNGITDMLTLTQAIKDMLALSRNMKDTIAFAKAFKDSKQSLKDVYDMATSVRELSTIHDSPVMNPGKWIRDMKMTTDSHAFALNIAQQPALPKDILSVINAIVNQQNSLRQQLDAIRMINSLATSPLLQFEKSLFNTLRQVAKSKSEQDAKTIQSVLEQVADIADEAESGTDVMSFLRKINACAKVITDGILAITKNETFGLLLLLYILGEKALTNYGLVLQLNTPAPATKQESRTMMKEISDSSDVKNTYFVAMKIDTLEERLKEKQNDSEERIINNQNKDAFYCLEDSVYIYSEASDTSKVIATLIKGQDVEVRRKRATFYDIDVVDDSGLITSGWVKKKFFKAIK